MPKKSRRVFPLSMVVTLVLGTQANGDTAATSPTIVMPQAHETIIASAGSLATSSAAALKNARSDTRDLAFRLALTKTILSTQAGTTAVHLDIRPIVIPNSESESASAVSV